MRPILSLSFKILRQTGRVRTIKLQKRFYEHTVTGGRVLDESTLTGRLLYYLNNRKNEDGGVNDEDLLKSLKERNYNQLGRYDLNHITNAFKMLSNRRYVSTEQDFLKILDVIDSEYTRRLSGMDTVQIFNILHNYIAVLPNRIIQCTFYKEALKKLANNLERLNKDELMKLIFFIGLHKKHVRVHDILRKCVNSLKEHDIQRLAVEEMCIICNATFKTSTKIDNELFLNKVIQYINDNLFLLKDPALFTTLIKTIRHNRCQTEDLLSSISCTVFFNKTLQYYNFSALCHILAIYSDYLYYDECLLKAFTDKSIEILKNNKFKCKSEQPRMKDIHRLLWSLSNLNYRYLQVSDIKDVVVPTVLQLYKNGGCKEDVVVLDITLFLWMLGYHAHELVPLVLTKDKIQMLRATSRNNHKLNLLLSCIFFEDRPLFHKINIHPQFEEYEVKYQLEKRPLLRRIVDNLRSLSLENEITKFELGCQIPGLNIIGVTGYQRNVYKAVNIEVLDKYTTLKNTDDMPTGLMQLKLRILDGAEEGLIVVTEDVDSFTDDQLKEYLVDELNLVC